MGTSFISTSHRRPPAWSGGHFEVIWCKKARQSKANEREQYKRQLRESLKDQMRESAEKRRAEFENSRNETARTIHDFRSRRYILSDFLVFASSGSHRSEVTVPPM